MSKRSYRRLAVVAGAALAVGSMAPAMAQRVEANGVADVSVDTIDVSSVLGGVQSNQLPTTLLLNSVGGIRNTALSTAFLAVSDAQTIAGDLVGGVTCVAGAGTEAVLGITGGAFATAGVGVGLGGVHLDLGLDALLGDSLFLAGDVTECLDDLKGDVFTTVSHAQAAVGGVTQVATSTALGAVASVGSLPGAVMTTATPLLLNDLLSVTASGGGSASAVAGLAGLVNFL